MKPISLKMLTTLVQVERDRTAHARGAVSALIRRSLVATDPRDSSALIVTDAGRAILSQSYGDPS